jgi:hypothetical protein
MVSAFDRVHFFFMRSSFLLTQRTATGTIQRWRLVARYSLQQLWEWEINGKARLFATPRIAQNVSENRHTA